jgi:hypothetical protein
MRPRRDLRPILCPGCHWALIAGRRARPGKLCVDCRAEKAAAEKEKR